MQTRHILLRDDIPSIIEMFLQFKLLPFISANVSDFTDKYPLDNLLKILYLSNTNSRKIQSFSRFL